MVDGELIVPLIGGPRDGDTKRFKPFELVPPNLKAACPIEVDICHGSTAGGPDVGFTGRVHDYRLLVYRLPMQYGEKHREFMAYVHEHCDPPIEMVIRASIRSEFG